MIEHRALMTRDGVWLRERRGLPGLTRWRACGFAAANELQRATEWSAGRAAIRLGLTVYLGTALYRLIVLPPIKAIRSLREFDAIATHAFSERFGLKSSEWQVRADPASALGIVACAVRHETLATVAALAKSLSQPVWSARPWAAHALGHMAGATVGHAPLLLTEPDGMLVCTYGVGGNSDLRAFPRSARPGEALGALGLDATTARRWRSRIDDTAPVKGMRGDFCDLLAEATA